MPSQAEAVAALQAAAPQGGGVPVGNAVQALNPRLAGDVVYPPTMSFHPGMDPQELYNRVLQQPSGADAIRGMGGKQAAPPNVLPINPSVQQRMGAMAGQQFAENTPRPAWMDQALRVPTGQFTSPQGPLQVTGPAMYRNGMRAIGVQPTEYNKKD